MHGIFRSYTVWGDIVSYAIKYGGRTPKMPRDKYRCAWIWVSLVAIALIMVAGFQYVWPEGQGVIVRMLLPGADACAVDAIEGLFGDIASGESVKEAFSDFCAGVIDHAKLPE